MINQGALFELVPDPPYTPDNLPVSFISEVSRRLAAWAGIAKEALRARVEIGNGDNGDEFSSLVRSSDRVGIGVLPVPWSYSGAPGDDFRVFEGYQFGIALYRTHLEREASEGAGALDVANQQMPVLQVELSVTGHGNGSASRAPSPDARIAAYFEDSDGRICGLTAAHAVKLFAKGSHVPVHCPHGFPTVLLSTGAGYLDVAKVHLGPACDVRLNRGGDPIRWLAEGETAVLHSALRGPMETTVMQGLDEPERILSSASPRTFFVDVFTEETDSGSLITAETDGALGGLYLGVANCLEVVRDGESYQGGEHLQCGYGLDMWQAAVAMDAVRLTGAR